MADTTEKSGVRDAVSKALEGPESMATPDLTKAQLIAVVQAIVAALVLLGKPPSDEVVTAAVAVISSLVLIMLPTSDALIRRERARNVGAIAAAKRSLRPAKAGVLREALEEELQRIEAASAPPAAPVTEAPATPDSAAGVAPGTADEEEEDEQ